MLNTIQTLLFSTGLNNLSKFLNGWVYIGIILGVAIILTIMFKGFQFLRFRQMYKSFIASENVYDKKITPIKVLVSSLASRFGLGNVVGVAVAIMVGGSGAVLWLLIVGSICMATSFVECTLSQIYHEKNPNNKSVYRGGLPYYILKGLGKNWKILAFISVIALFLSKGVFIVATIIGIVSQQIDLTFFHPINNAHDVLNTTSKNSIVQWIVVGIITLFMIAIVFFGPIQRTVNFTHKLLPITMIIVAILIISSFFFFNNAYFLWESIKEMFTTTFGGKSSQFLKPVTGAILGVAIQQGVARGIFAHEAGQGSTPAFAAIPKVDHPIKVGFGQSLATFVDTFIICGMMGLFFSMLSFRAHNYFHWSPTDTWNYFSPGSPNSSSVIQQNFISYLINHIFIDNPTKEWLVVFNKIGAIIFIGVFLVCMLGVSLGSFIICESLIIFLFRNRNHKEQAIVSFITKLVILTAMICGPLITRISPNIFTFSDLTICLCFFTNLIPILLLSPIVVKVLRDFDKNITKELLGYLNSDEHEKFIKYETQQTSLKDQNNLVIYFIKLSISRFSLYLFRTFLLLKYRKKITYKMHFNHKDLKIYNKEFGKGKYKPIDA